MAWLSWPVDATKVNSQNATNKEDVGSELRRVTRSLPGFPAGLHGMLFPPQARRTHKRKRLDRQLDASVRLERKVHGLALTCRDGNFLRHRSELLVPRFHCVLPGRKIRKLEGPVFTGHRKVGMLKDSDVTLHPRMHVALHRDRDLLAGKALFHRCAGRLRFVPFSVISRKRMN